MLPELLSPAGNDEALHAAVDCGANAVYLGSSAFGARAAACFDDESLSKAVSYAHLYRCRVYVTVNTLVKPNELDSLYDTLQKISAAKADAVIVQDLSVASMVHYCFPSLKLHASTQMAICNEQGAQYLSKLGFDRVVPARECTLSDIRSICRTGIETEVFIHGALCTSVSGRCLMSSMSGDRSGNRGRCAQPCRQCFRFENNTTAHLSMRDLCTINSLADICNSGVSSLKIEGRLKSPEYVATVTRIYRQALDSLHIESNGTFVDTRTRVQRETAQNELIQVFNRGNFTEGHLSGREDADLISSDVVSHKGLFIGRVIAKGGNLIKVSVEHDLHNEDSLTIHEIPSSDTRYSGPEVSKGEIASIRLRTELLQSVRVGMNIYRLSDSSQLSLARNHAPNALPVDAKGIFETGKPMCLSLFYNSSNITVYGDPVQQAENHSTSRDTIEKQLMKMGGSPFVISNKPDVTVSQNAYISLSSLNALRRLAVEQLSEKIRNDFYHSGVSVSNAVCNNPGYSPFPSVSSRPFSDLNSCSLAVIFSEPSAASKLKKAGADLLIFSPVDMRESHLEESLKKLDMPVFVRIPPQAPGSELRSICSILQRQSNVTGLWLESISHFDLLPFLPAVAGEGIPCTNQLSIQSVINQGLSGFSLWPEWTLHESKSCFSFSSPCFVKVYGRETVMLLNHCLKRSSMGLSAGRKNCSICKHDNWVCGSSSCSITDRMGYSFPLIKTRFERGCEISVLSSLPTDLRSLQKEIQRFGCKKLLHFSIEPIDIQERIVRYFAENNTQSTPSLSGTTTGHRLRAVL